MPEKDARQKFRIWGLLFLRYLSEQLKEITSRILVWLGLVSTFATFIPRLQEYSLLKWGGALCILIGVIEANFRVYLKHAVERLEFTCPSFQRRTRASNDRQGANPEFYAQIRATNNSERSCSIVDLRVSDEGGWNWHIVRSQSSPLPISIPADTAIDFDLWAYLPHMPIHQASDKIRIGRLLLEIQDHTKKPYRLWLTEEAHFGPWRK